VSSNISRVFKDLFKRFFLQVEVIIIMDNPSKYESMNQIKAKRNEVFDRLAGKMVWSKNERILDFGCGPGHTCYHYILPEAEKHDSEIYAIDISAEMIDHGIKNWSHPRIKYSVWDVIASKGEGFPGGVTFHKVIAISVLHWIKECQLALSYLFKTMESGGYIGFTIWDKLQFEIIQELGEHETWKAFMKGYKQYVPYWVEEKEDVEAAFRRYLTTSEFEILELYQNPQKYEADIKLETIVEFFLLFNPYLKDIPEHLHLELKIWYFSFFQRKWKSRENRDYKVLYAVARKPLSVS